MFKFILAFLISTSSAALTPSDIAKTPIRNALLNPGAENGKVGWAVSTGSFTASNSTPLDGNASFVWDAGASAETLSSAITVPEWLKGQNAVVSCQVRCATGTCTHSIRALVAGTSVASSAITSSTTASPRATVNFVAPTSGAVGVELYANADEPSLKIDNCYIARADEWNLYQVSQASLYGSLNYAATANCTWPNTNTSYTDFPADTDCPTATVTGFASAPGTKIPGVTFTSLPPGDYLVMVGISTSKSGGPTLVGYRWHDGTNSGGDHFTDSTASNVPVTLTGRFSYTTAQSNITFRLQGFRTGGTNVQIANEDNPFQVKVYRFPSSSELAYRPDLAIQWGGIATTVSAIEATLSSTSTWDNVSEANWATKTLLGSATAGTTSTHLSFKMPYLAAGSYEVCSNYSVTSASGAACYAAMYDGTSRVIQFADSNLASAQDGRTLGCGVVNYTSAQANLEFFIQMYSAGTTTNCRLDGNLVSSSGAAKYFYIKPVGVSVQAPLLVGSVTSNSSGLERVERARLTVSGACTIASQSGSWLSSCTYNGSGNVTLNFASGVFAAAPSCVATATGGNRQAMYGETPSSSSWQVYASNSTFNGVSDANFSVICMGPR